METIFVAIIGSGALSALISGIFNLVQSRNSRVKAMEKDIQTIKEQLATAEKDTLRTQLMLMIKDYPDENTDILRLGEHYFKNLKGNWVMTDIFRKWCEDQHITPPSWFE